MTTGTVVWLTGLPASGKSTLSQELHARLLRVGVASCVLDGDVMRGLLAPRLGYSDEERAEFYGLLARLAAELARQGLIVLVPATAHRRAYRELARQLAPLFLEVWVVTPLEECQARDPKGLYATAGTVPGHLPGIDLPYEEPTHPDVVANGGMDALAIERLLSALLH